MRAPRLVVLGRQGAGKGTQCARLADDLDIDHVSTGDLFRAAVASGTRLGEKVSYYLDAGELVPDEIVVDAVVRHLALLDAYERGYVLDGFPRTVAQAEAIEAILGAEVWDHAIEIDVPSSTVLPRIAARRVCRGCGLTYQAPEPAMERWRCEQCGGEVARRADDSDAAIRRRLELYDTESGPLLVWLDSRGIFTAVDGTGPPGAVYERLLAAARANITALADAG